jgi:PIN domain nuclease of toxin-antitoxin system
VKYLLDTHTVIWLAENSSKLSRNATQTILNIENKMYVSIASAWEVAIKCGLNKLILDNGVMEFFKMTESNGIAVVPVKAKHLLTLQNLPFLHRDPFDRLLVATAISEDMSIITADECIALYEASVVW